MIECLIKEIELRSTSLVPEERIFEGEKVETIYFGGGTPSLMTGEETQRILKAIYSKYDVSEEAEITLEANPDDITLEKSMQWQAAGINRLSIGIQSFIERDLKWMNRAHNATQATEAIKFARQSGIDNISVDLIFGTPGLTNEEWVSNIKIAVKSGVNHIAAYALTVEPRTALQKMIALRKKENINPDEQADQFSILIEQLNQCGFEHYEISNFAIPGHRSRHNSSYWQGKKYMGIGPSAHSYNGLSRTWNLANNALYIQSLQKNIVPFETEQLTIGQRLNEYIMISLRTVEGVDLEHVGKTFSSRARMVVVKNAETDLREGNLQRLDGRLALTNKGKLLADAISVRLFVD